MNELPNHSRRRGVALLMVLWVVLIAGLMLLGVMQATRMQAALSHGDLAAVQAHWLARAGVEQAMAVLEDDEPAVDGELDKWFREDSLFKSVSLGAGTFNVASAADEHRAGLDDESARINLNVADQSQLKELKSLNDTQIHALLEWRTEIPIDLTGGAASATGARNGSSGNSSGGGFYQQLRYPYEMRHKDLQTHRELFLIQGFEDRKFFGDPRVDLAANGPAALTTVYSYERTRDLTGKARINLNTATAEQLQERFNFTPALAAGLVQARQPQFQNFTAVLNVRPSQGGGGSATPSQNKNEPVVSQMSLQWLAGHMDQLSLDAGTDGRLPGKININTAPRDVLITLPGLNGEIADRIISQRGASGGDIKTLDEVLTRNIAETDVFRRFFDRLTVRSDVFSVESTGISPGGMSRKIFAVIDRGQTPMRILYWYQT